MHLAVPKTNGLSTYCLLTKGNRPLELLVLLKEIHRISRKKTLVSSSNVSLLESLVNNVDMRPLMHEH